MEKSRRLAIITTHPIQYNAPFFKKLAASEGLTLMVFYTWEKGAGVKHDPGFGKKIEWDIPTLEGYSYTFVKNVSKNPGSHHFWGIQNPSLIAEISSFQPDSILVYGWNFHSHLQVMRHFKGTIPIWFRGDSTLLDEKLSIKTILRRLFLRWVYTQIDYSFFTGTENKKYYLKHGVKERQLIAMPHAVDNDFFMQNDEENTKQAQILRHSLSIPDNDFVILFAGKFEQKKNPTLLIDIFIGLQENNKFTNSHLIFIGNGILEPLLKQKGLKNPYIHFLPFQNQTLMPIIYRMCDVFCLPSKGPGETWGLALNEAMACGKPVIASNKVGGAKDLIIENTTGLIFKNNNRIDLEKAILKALDWKKQGLDQKKILRHVTNFNFIRNSTIIIHQLNQG